MAHPAAADGHHRSDAHRANQRDHSIIVRDRSRRYASVNAHEAAGNGRYGMSCIDLADLGFAFVSQVQGMASMSPLFFNATRFTLGAISLIPLLLWKRLRRCRESGKTVGAGNREAGDGEHDMIAGSALSNPLIVGMICGVFLFAASTLQQYGIMFGRSAGRARIHSPRSTSSWCRCWRISSFAAQCA